MTWSNYIRIKKIGEGAFGSAWLVKCTKDNNQYVIKQINVAKMPAREKAEAIKEVHVLAQMKHSNIVSYVDSFEEAGNLCIVMDYCDGGDLYTKIQSMRGIPLSEDQILDWFVQITLALKHVHDRKILHRDLKSQNIFLTKDGIVKLGDFGVAKVLNTTVEFAKTAIGTPYYMSPEICEHKPYNNKSDVWSLGCILFEMTNMKHPFEANNLQMLIQKILRGNYDQVNPKYSYELRNLVACMLKRNPRERPSVNGILRKPFIRKRCEKFLTDDQMAEEFSHTVLHGENFKKKIENPNLVNKPSSARVASKQSLYNGPVLVNNPAGNIAPRPMYDPSKIYNAPVVKRPVNVLQKSVEKKVVEIKKRPPSVERQYSEIRGSYLEQREKKRELEEALLKKKQRELIEKQKIERMNKDRENKWQNLLPAKDEPSNLKEEKNSAYPFVNNNRGCDPVFNVNYYERFEKQLEEHARKRRELEEDQEKMANKFKNPKPSPVIRPRSAVKSSGYGINKPVAKSSEYKRIKEEFERNRANDRKVFNNPFTPRPPIIKKNADAYRRVIQIKNHIKQSENILKEKTVLKIQKDMLNKPNKESDKRLVQANEKELRYIEEESKKKGENIQKFFKPAPPVELTKALEAIGVNGKKINLKENPAQENRKIWNNATDLKTLENRPIIELTKVTRSESEIETPRKWDAPHETILQALEKAKIQTLKTVSFNKSDIDDETIKNTIVKDKNISDCVDSKRKNRESSSNSSSSLLMNEKPPKILQSMLDTDFKSTWDDVILPVQMKTKNILNDMTMGKFDPKNTKMLRTCSDPDIFGKIFNDESDDEDVIIPAKNQNFNTTSVKKTIRLARSLDDLDKKYEKLSENSDKSDLEELEKKSIDSGRDKMDYEIEDLTGIIESMQILLDDDQDEKSLEGNMTIKKLNRNLIEKKEITLDSLEISQKNLNDLNDDNDCEIVSLNGDESDGSDTEFEEEEDTRSNFEKISIEERRANLEKNLGHLNFATNIRNIKMALLKEEENERKFKNNQERESFKLFCQMYPNKSSFWYEELCDLIKCDY